MRIRDYGISLGVALYIFLTLNGLAYTVAQRSLLPRRAVRFFYGMLAPYQSYGTNNVELVAEGKTKDGSWETIDLLPYFPGSTGERTFRELLLSRRAQGETATAQGYAGLAEQIRIKEMDRGRSYSEVRLHIDTWPMAPDGYEVLRLPVFTKAIDPVSLE
ncbi:hypothetical protein A2881_00835 [Candidatus Peribacteria bacterium RIFCSPHIGHO2_01_FULL_55_13]|nr:MAG: hypothetical protein A2881_00835 [Candidatus Peribacteria bacterium RIFCSPHIGHO2_01_FULL_55_13]OGJ66134.1 MAG: hypothetical protein A3F36_01365 [Candidatus Peribacteria bacterium RIFCSPHIGHO2_12_FULL_55_11]